MAQIHEALVAIMRDIDAIEKNSQTNFGDKYKFRGIDAAMNYLHPILAKHGVFIMPEILNKETSEYISPKGAKQIHTELVMKYTLCAADGSTVTMTMPGEGIDTADKGTGKAMSTAFKYAFFQMFCIPTEGDMKDVESEAPELVEQEQGMGKKFDPAQAKRGANYKPAPTDKLADLHPDFYNAMIKEMLRTGYGAKSVCKNYGVADMKDMTFEQREAFMAIMSTKPDKQVVEVGK